ncbi:MAG: ABC transporter permease [Oscillospiraceae bacterium]|nr:ABC transporter permease [Oscillospiraceae bacterium]
MVIGIKDIFKLIGIIIISICAVFVCTLFLNYNIDLQSIENKILSVETKALFDALVMSGTVVSAVSGGCLLITAVVMLCFYIKHYIDSHRKELGILKALGYSNLRISSGFWVFGLSVFFGSAVGFAGAHCLMPKFYSVQNEDKLLPEFEPGFHLELFLSLVILPTVIFALMSVVYSLLKMKTPVLELLRGKSVSKIKAVKDGKDLPFLKDIKRATVRGRKSLVFFIAFAAFCYSAMVQMSFGIDELASEMMSFMILGIGLTLAFVTLFIAVTTIVRSNAESVSIMRVFGYSRKECSVAVLSGYRPAAIVGFAVGTGYQYLLLKIAVEVVFKDIENVPEFDFNLRALIIAAVSFVIFYEVIMYLYSRKIGKISVKEIMLDSVD